MLKKGTMHYIWENSQQLQDTNQIKIFFPSPLAEKLGVNPNFHDKPIGNERHGFKHVVSSIVHVFRYCKNR